MLMTADVIRI